MSAEIADPKVREMVAKLPIMRNGQPRRFRRFCECFEWVFNLYHDRHTGRYHNPAAEIERTDRLAGALWHHQNPAIAAWNRRLDPAEQSAPRTAA